jgi:hypothetical protein
MFGDKKERIKPFEFIKPGEKFQLDAINWIEKDINGTTRFAITKLTAGGKFMRGGKLFFELNGVQIYTEDTNVIFVDTNNNTIFIKDYEKVQKEINPDNPEERQYILLYTDLGYESAGNEEEFPLRWEAVSGRTAAYDNIKLNASVIDIDKSLVLVESVPFKDSLTVRQFAEYLKNSDIIQDTTFDINDYSSSEYC